MRRSFRLAAAVLVVTMSAAAADTPDQIIAARQAGYKHIGDITKSIKDALDAGQDVKPFAAQAREIADWGRKIPTLFPPGTETGHDTKARPEIWSDRAGFEAAAAKLPPAAEKLASIAETGDKSAFVAQFKEMGSVCGACHRAYRYKS